MTLWPKPARPSATVLGLLAALFTASIQAQSVPPAEPPSSWGAVSINLEGVPYPYPVNFLHRNLYGQDVRIAYMDVSPAGNSNGQTVVLLHGASYYGWYWEDAIDALSEAGFRVITVDRLGWGRSSKPIIPYDVSLHASNIKAILDSLGIDRAAIAGHSMGGRIASHFVHIYPETSSHLVMVNPIGLGESSRGRTWREPSSGDLQPNLQEVYESNLGLEQRRVVEWKPEFLEHVRIRYGYTLSGEYPRQSLVRSLNSGVLSAPVDSYWPQINTPSLLLSGAQDGPDFPTRAQRAVDLLPDGEIHLIPEAGHNPHLETPEILNRELIRFLSSPT
ncbi:MAG: alpha/beta hydrolase [Pseudohongiellaceae bacterium]